MSASELRNEYKALCNAEVGRRDELNKAVDRPIAIITALLGGIYFGLSDLAAPVTIMQCLRALVGLVAGTLLGFAIYSLIRSMYRHTYGFMATPRTLEEYRSKLEAYHREHLPCPPEEIERKVLAHVHALYVESGHQNALINDERSGHLYNVKRVLVWAVPTVSVLLLLKIVSLPGFTAWIDSLRRLLIGVVTS